MLRELLEIFEERLAPQVEKIARYDRETEAKGGRPGVAVYPQFDPSNGDTLHGFWRAHWQQAGELGPLGQEARAAQK